MYQSGMREEASVDLMDLVKRLVVEARAILLVALLAALALFGFYQKKYRDEQRALVAESAAEQRTTEESLRAGLTQDELDAVSLAVNQSRMIHNRTVYLTQSGWMQEGGATVKSLRLLIRLQGDGLNGNYLKSFYGSYMSSTDFAEAVKSLLDDSYSTAAAAELVTTDVMIYTMAENPGDPTTMSVNVVVPETVDENTAFRTLEQAILAYKAGREELIGAHTVEFVTEDVKESFDQSPAARRRELLYELYNLRMQLKATLDVFSTRQRLLYEKMTGLLSEEEFQSTSTSTSRGYGKGMLLAGAAIAIFLYICAAALSAILSGRVRSVKEVTVPACLGELRSYQAGGPFDRLFRSRTLYKAVYRKTGSADAVAQKSVLIAKSDAIEQLKVVLFGSDSACTEKLQTRISDLCAASGIGVEVQAVPGDETFIPAVGAEEDGFLFVLKAGETNYRALRETVELCGLSGKKVIGYVLCGN